MRLRIWLAIGALCVAPLAAGAQQLDPAQAAAMRNDLQAHPAECARLRRQIDHFAGMAGRAKQLDNEMWIERTEDHLGMLRGIQAARCPGDVPVDTTAEAFKELVRLGAKAALAYFTFGAAGF